jgi:hypothetical protein
MAGYTGAGSHISRRNIRDEDGRKQLEEKDGFELKIN